MNATMIVGQVVLKTRIGKLQWEPTADPNEMIAAFGGGYVLRMAGPRALPMGDYPPTLSVETAGGQVVVSIAADDRATAGNAEEVGVLWEMIRCGGKSAEEAADEALSRLMEL